METIRRSSAVNPKVSTATGGDVADVVVLGAGLAGLTAALTAARTGATVTVIEARQGLGGRARSDQVKGFTLNHGAHALYTHGPGARILRHLGVRPRGHIPQQRGAGWDRDGERFSLLNPRHVGGAAGMVALGTMLRHGLKSERFAGQSTSLWLDHHVPKRTRPAAEALLRTTTYVADLDDLDAGAALAQLVLGSRGVLYLDGGWASLVSQLHRLATDAGVTFTVDRATAVHDSRRCVEIELRAGGLITAGAVVAAGLAPDAVHNLTGASNDSLGRWSTATRPVRAACLDLALADVGRHPSTTYGLGEPTYLVDHAVTAHLAPPGGAVFHGLFYEPRSDDDPAPRTHLEGMLTRVVPQWRSHLVECSYRRQLVVAHDRARPVNPASLPGVEIPGFERVFVAGDWLTSFGMLADAAVGSAARAAQLAAARSATAPAPR